MAYLHMRKNIIKLFVLMAMTLGLILLSGISAMAANPLTCTVELTPRQLASPGSVRVAINVTNISDDAQPVSVTLYDPANQVCTSFGSGGTANLAAGASAAYTGNWTVSQKELDAGRVIFTARYTIAGVDGNPGVSATQPITGNITHNKAEAKLKIDRYIEPGTKVQSGTTVTIKYAIKNVGTLDIKDITIKDPGITDEVTTYPLLAVGKTAEVSYQFVAGTTSKTTHAEISYKYDLDGKEQSPKPGMADSSTIEVLVPDLVVQLETKQLIVNKGDKVKIIYKLINRSDMRFEKLKVTDELLKDIDSNLSVGANETKEFEKEVTISGDTKYKFTVTGVDESGNEVKFESNELTIQTTETGTSTTTAEAIPVVLDLVVEANREMIYALPGEVQFKFVLTNNGVAAVENVTIQPVTNIKDRFGPTVKTVERIEPGETMEFIIPLDVSMAGEFKFVASAKDNTGATMRKESNAWAVAYTAPEPTASPTPAPTEEPTPDPFVDPNASETPFAFEPPETQGGGLGSILLYILAGVFGLVIIGVGVVFFLDRRRGGRPGGGGGGGYAGPVKVIDSIERVPHSDYTRAPKKGTTSGGRREVGPPPEAAAAAAATGAVAARQTRPERDALAPYDAYDDLPDLDDEGGQGIPSAYEPEPPQNTTFVYQRPAAETQPEPEQAPYIPPVIPAVEEEVVIEPAEEPQPTRRSARTAPSMEDTSVYSRGYLDRIKGAAKDEPKAEENTPTAAEPAEPGKVMSEEEATLMSGGTAEYRLTNRSGSVRNRKRTSPLSAEDPEAFSRQRRATRTTKPGGIADFYDDDEETDANDDDDSPYKRPKR